MGSSSDIPSVHARHSSFTLHEYQADRAGFGKVRVFWGRLFSRPIIECLAISAKATETPQQARHAPQPDPYAQGVAAAEHLLCGEPHFSPVSQPSVAGLNDPAMFTMGEAVARALTQKCGLPPFGSTGGGHAA